MPSPTGQMIIMTDQNGVLRLFEWTDHEDRMHRLLTKQYRGQAYEIRAGQQPSHILAALTAYFDGEVAAVDTLETETGGTQFQNQVWAALRTIEVGCTLSYAGLAQRIGNPSAMRAVGLANGANPIAIVVPCHRVIGANGTLTGYGGGLDRKFWLLKHEGALPENLL